MQVIAEVWQTKHQKRRSGGGGGGNGGGGVPAKSQKSKAPYIFKLDIKFKVYTDVEIQWREENKKGILKKM